MQRLAAEKIHGPHRFEKEHGRRRHTPCHNSLGNPFEQCEIIRGEGLLVGTQGKGMPETLPEILRVTGYKTG